MRVALLAFLGIALLQPGCGSTDKPAGGTTGGSGGSPDSGGMVAITGMVERRTASWTAKAAIARG